tara:strand:+ start:1771 stop:2088 length:318 start_codon:yes stop_codon:yes gene_type:complete
MSEISLGKEIDDHLTAADYQAYADEVQDKWVTYGPSQLATEAKGLASEAGIDIGVAMTACVESKRNYELQMIRKALYEIVGFSNSLISIEGIANILSRIEEKVES